MNTGVGCALFALAYNWIPELREQRDRYYQFWNILGLVAIAGWVLVYVVHRFRPAPADANVWGRWLRMVATGLLVTAGLGLGWGVWQLLQPRSWGDIGAGDRWKGELAVCMLGCVAWLLVLGQLGQC